MTMLELSPEEVYDKLVTSGNLTVVVGRRGSGKTAFGFHICEKAKDNDKQVFIVGFPEDAKTHIPGYINVVSSLKDVPNGSFALLDEAILQFNARNWRSSKNLSLTEIADLARHKDLSVVFIAINTAMLDPNVLRTIDTLILKEPSLLQEHMERPFLKKFLIKTGKAMKDIKIDERMKYAYVFDDRLEGLVKTPLASFWSDELSKSWKDYTALEDGKKEGIKVIGAASMGLGLAPICFDCAFFVHTQYEAWCSKGLDVGVTECDSFQEKRTPKTYTWKEGKSPEKKPPWMANPPEGCHQCETCGNFEGETEQGMMCKHFQKPVKFIEGTCDYKIKMGNSLFSPNPKIQSSEEQEAYKKKIIDALEVYIKFKQPYTKSDGKTHSFWKQWLDWLEPSFKLISSETAGSDVYEVKDTEWEVQVHKAYKSWQVGMPLWKKSPMSCNCTGWKYRRLCKHTKKLADDILYFAEANEIKPTELPMPPEVEPIDAEKAFVPPLPVPKPPKIATGNEGWKLKFRIGSQLHLQQDNGHGQIIGGEQSRFGETESSKNFMVIEKGKWYPIPCEHKQQFDLYPFDPKTGLLYQNPSMKYEAYMEFDGPDIWIKLNTIDAKLEDQSWVHMNYALINFTKSPLGYLTRQTTTKDDDDSDVSAWKRRGYPIKKFPDTWWGQTGTWNEEDVLFSEDGRTLLYPHKEVMVDCIPQFMEALVTKTDLNIFLPTLYKFRIDPELVYFWNSVDSIGYKITYEFYDDAGQGNYKIKTFEIFDIEAMQGIYTGTQFVEGIRWK